MLQSLAAKPNLFAPYKGEQIMLSASDRAKLQDGALKPYKKPTLIKGPVLSAVTAEDQTVSGIAPIN